MATVIVLTSGTSWTVPAGYNVAGSKVEAIGGGASGRSVSTINVSFAGGGGGAYTSLSNFDPLGATTIPYAIGAGGALNVNGGDTTFNTTSVVAKGGLTPINSTGGLGGSGAACTPAGTSGGNGGNGIGAASSSGAGGGGAAGPNGAGNAGANGVSGIGQTGGAGGRGDGTTGGLGGGGGTSGLQGTSGSAGTELGGGVGAGGAGGGGGSQTVGDGMSGGNGGLYGGGGGGPSAHNTACNAWNSPIVNAGAQGVIIITYTPAGGRSSGFIFG